MLKAKCKSCLLSARRHAAWLHLVEFGCCLPAGKRELPAGIRNRFTELWVAEPDQRADLEAIVAAYLLGSAPQPPIAGVVNFYLAAKAAAVGLFAFHCYAFELLLLGLLALVISFRAVPTLPLLWACDMLPHRLRI